MLGGTTHRDHWIDYDEVFCRASVPQSSGVDVNAFTVCDQAAVP